MVQNDIGAENDNDGFIIPVNPITPGPCNSPTSPLFSRKTRRRGFSISAPTPGHSERDGDQFISYPTFLSRYWNHFPQQVTRVLGMCTPGLLRNPYNFGGRSGFGFWRNSGSDQRFRAGHRHTATVYRSGCLLIWQSSRDVFPHEGCCVRTFHRIH